MRYTATQALSRQTLGYSKGRSVSGALRPTLNASTFTFKSNPTSARPRAEKLDTVDPDTMSVDEYIKARGVPKTGSRMWYKALDEGYFENGTDALEGKLAPHPGEGLENLFKDEVVDEEDGEVFQLSLEESGLVD